MVWFDPMYLIVLIPTMILMGIAQFWVKSAYSKYSQVANRQGVTGAEAAQVILRSAGIYDVRVEPVRGFLSDHYDPRGKVLRLSPENYSGTSIAAVGIAAHEAGHAMQHAQNYAPLVLRNLAVPAASIGSGLGWAAITGGAILAYMGAMGLAGPLILFGIFGIAAVVVFQLINLPVEFDASRRALQVLPGIGILDDAENAGARKVLNAAAMTYVAATIAAVAQLLYLLWRFGFIGGRND